MANTTFETTENRRKYPRFKAPICYRSAPLFASLRKPLVNISLGGIRIYSDEKIRLGKRLEVELILPDDTILTCMALVIWVNPLPEGSDSKYDVGLQFTAVPEDKLHHLDEILNRYAEPASD
jgi:c-di-GMP-binding flagellar brake protein YcgR